MPFDIDPIYLIYLLRGAGGRAVRRRRLSAVLHDARRTARTSTAACKLLEDQPDREGMLVQLRRERGLSSDGDYRLPLVALNRLILQSGLTLGIGKLAIYRRRARRCSPSALVMVVARRPAAKRSAPRLFCGTLLPLLRAASSCAAGGRRSSARNSPTRSTSSCAACAPAIRCRSRSPWWRAKCPIRSAPSSASSPTRSPTAPISKPRMRNLYFRIGQDDLPLFVTAVAIQGSTGGNLGEILENLSARHPPALQDAAQDPRARRRRPRLGDDPVVAADRDVPGHPGHRAGLLRQRLARGPHQDLPRRPPAAGWAIGNFIMYRMVNFRI